MDNSLPTTLPVLPSSPLVTPQATITSSVGENGFYTDIPQFPTHTESDVFDITPDRKYLIIGCVLGITMLVLLTIGSVFAIKLYRRKRAKEVIKEKADEEYFYENIDDHQEEGEESRHLSLPPSYTSQSGSSKKLQLSSILNPRSQFSLAIQRASEIPNSPTSPKP